MAIGFIPNQPILFTTDTQACKNSDPKQYAQLLQQDDVLCVQFNNSGTNAFVCTGDNLISNGTFGTSAGWTLGTGWSIGSGYLQSSNSSADNFATTACTYISGAYVLVTYTIALWIDGEVKCVLGDGGSSTSGTLRSATGTYTEVLRYVDSDAVFQFTTGTGADFRGSIDNVTVVQLCLKSPLLDAETDWSYSVSTGNYTHVAGTDALWTAGSAIATNGVSQYVTFTVIGMTTGTVQPTWVDVSDDSLELFGTTISGNGTYTFYSTPSQDSAFGFSPSTDFDGTIITSSIQVGEMSYGHSIKLIDSDGNVASETINTSTDNPIVYDGDWMTWCADWDTIESFDVPGTMIPSGCYTIRVFDDYTSTNYNSSTVVSYLKSGTHDCTVMIEATCSQYGYGFNFGVGDFSLNQRLAILRISPKYPSDQDTYIYSTGRHKRTFAQSEKIWTMWVRKIDEWAHDALRTQLICDTLTIDGVEYFCPADSYEPEWTENMNQNLAPVRIDLQKVQDVIFNKNL